MRHRRGWLSLGLLVLLGLLAAEAQAGTVRYVNATDSTCGGDTPCSTTIQAAVTAAQSGDTIQIQAGAYTEQVLISGRNNTDTANETDRIVIQADPTALVGSVVLHGAVTECTNGAIQLQQSKFITIRGLVITGAGGPAVSLEGGTNQNQAIHIERNRLVGNGGSACTGGITIAQGNPDTLIVNNLIYGNGRNGIATLDATGGPHELIENTIHGNGWNGVRVSRDHQVILVNNAITGNGTMAGSSGGRFGVSRDDASPANPVGIQLLHNLICGNRLGEIDGLALDATDQGNLTPTGREGLGVTASPGCDTAATVYANVNGADQLANTVDDDFTLAAGSPALDRGRDLGTLGLPSAVTPRLEADYSREAARPRAGTTGGRRCSIWGQCR